MMPRLILALALAGPPGQGWAQDIGSEAPTYCSDLQRVTSLAMTRERFASIAGKPREGNFRDTTLPLTGWRDCSLYGPTSYTCDSQGFKSAAQAVQAQATTVDQILSCFAGTWLEIKDRSSPRYVVLNPARGPASMTLSIDENENGESVVRLTLFIRRN
jgi:hypothetical protein